MRKEGSIILVEDDVDDQELIAEIIYSHPSDNSLRIFHNGKEAFEYLKTTPDLPFLIICDINMPVMDGLELRKQMHGFKELKSRSAPFIFLSTTDDEKVVDQAYELSVQGFFKKPHDFNELKNILLLAMDYWRQSLFPDN